MPANQVYNATQARTLDAAVRTIAVATGSIVVTPPTGFGEPFTLAAGDTHEFEGKPVAGLTIFSPNSARINITYGDDKPAKAEQPSRVRRRSPRKSTATKRAAKRSSAKSSASKSKSRKKG